MPVRRWMSWKMATSSVGVMASERVSRTRANRDQRRFKKPWAKERRSGWQLLPGLLFKHHHHLSTDLHYKLARVGPRHGGALTCCQDPHCPDVEGHRAKEAAQDHTLQTQTLQQQEPGTKNQVSGTANQELGTSKQHQELAPRNR